MAMESGASILVNRTEQTPGDERERLLEELSRTNRRLMGALDIVLGTLDSPNTSTLFERVLEELRNTTDALGTALYLATSDGFCLEGVSSSIEVAAVPRSLPRGGALMDLLVRQRQPICLDVLSSADEDGRGGAAEQLVVRNQHTEETYQVDPGLLSLFESVVFVPVSFGGRVIALLQAGWRDQHAIPQEAMSLLGGVSRYLAMPFAGALSALKAQRRQERMQEAGGSRVAETHGSDHKRDQRVAQALREGVRNDLQEVPGVTARGAYAPATEAALVGSDFYLLVRLPERRACVIVGDVSGKGVEAAAMAAAVRTALGAYAWEGLTPAQMVGRVNDLLLGMSNAETYASLFVGVVDLADAELVYCSAGHPPALLWHPEARELALLSEQSGLAGAFHDMAYHDGRAALSAGDVLFLYTDGAAEARGEKGGFFGEDGMRDAMVREAAQGFEGLVERMMQSVEEFAGGHLVDDVAMVALRVDEVGQ